LTARPLGALWWGLPRFLPCSQFKAAWLDMPELAWAAVIAPLFILPTPWKLPFRGVTSPLSWTPRAVRAYAGILLAQVLVGVLTVYLLGPAGCAHSHSFHGQPG
jgi:hypothetical protein